MTKFRPVDIGSSHTPKVPTRALAKTTRWGPIVTIDRPLFPVVEVRDRNDRIVSFAPQPRLGSGRFVPLQPERVLFRNYTLFELNLFPTGRVAPIGVSDGFQKVAGRAVNGGAGAPWIGLASVEATSASDPTPRIATCVGTFPSASRVVPGRKQIPTLPSARSRSLIGGQSCVVDTRDGPRVVAAYRADWTFLDGTLYRELWIAEIGPDGTTTVSRIPAERARGQRADLVYPAIAAGISGRDRAFLAWPVSVGGQAGIATSLLTRGTESPPRWRAATAAIAEWPVYPTFGDTRGRGFHAGLAADTDFRRSEYILAAVKGDALPFLARYDASARLLANPEAIGDCGEPSHATVELRVHPTTSRVLLQLQHNTMYFEQRAGARGAQYFQALDDYRRPTDLTLSHTGADGSTKGPCNVLYPFRRSGIRGAGESTNIGIGHLSDSEFAIAGPWDAPDGRLSTSVLAPAGALDIVDSVWSGRQSTQQLLVLDRHGVQVVVSMPLSIPTDGIPMGAVVVGAVQ